MKKQLQYVLILLLCVWCTPALAQIDCNNLEQSALAEPAEVFQACHGVIQGSGETPQRRDPTDSWFGMDYGFVSPDGLYTDMINSAPPHTLIGAGFDNAMFACEFTQPSTFTELFCIENNTQQLFSVSTATGVATLIGPSVPLTNHTWTGMAVDPSAPANVYVSSTDGVTSQLYTIDLGTGVATPIGPMTGFGLVIDIAFDLTGQLYGHDIGTDEIISINKATGAAAAIGLTGVDSNFAQGMDLDASDGTIYLFAYFGGGAAEVRSVNTTTGATTLVVDNFGFEMDGAIATNPLPVELSSFDARVDGQDVVLDWATASETNNAGFEVQHKIGEVFLALDFVEGYGSTLEAQTYSYRVDDLEPGRHTFRLKQIDFDGAFEFHPEVEVLIGVPDAYVMDPVYPNPFNPQTSLRFAVGAEQPVTVTLYNTLGRAVQTVFAGQVEANTMQTVRIDGSGLPSGAYVLQLKGQSFQAAQQVILLK